LEIIWRALGGILHHIEASRRALIQLSLPRTIGMAEDCGQDIEVAQYRLPGCPLIPFFETERDAAGFFFSENIGKRLDEEFFADLDGLRADFQVDQRPVLFIVNGFIYKGLSSRMRRIRSTMPSLLPLSSEA
jgi:hypothetical protein